MFIFQVLMGASSPGVYAMSQILAGPRASGRWVGIQNSLGQPVRRDLALAHRLSSSIAPGHFTLAFVLARW